ncbi:MAG: protein phosphatase 2C domain-containing protein [Candidatus Thorarchaeota archaeon]
MNIDHFLKIGKSHKICEDYIISGHKPIPHVILSDGCSSSPNTDLGARILAHLAKQFIISSHSTSKLFDHDWLGDWVIENSKLIIDKMGLDYSCLDATLIVLFSIYDYVYVYMYGDGVVISFNSEKDVSFSRVVYTDSAPYYLTYRIDKERDILYDSYDMTMSVEKISINNQEISKELNHFKKDDIPNYKKPFFDEFKVSEHKGILIASDGIESFIDKYGQPHNFGEVLTQIVSFKNIKGEFIKRRMGSRKGLLNTFESRDITHYDDISIGGFIF